MTKLLERRRALFAVGAAALAAALVAAFSTVGRAGGAVPMTMNMPMHMQAGTTAKQVAFHDAMRKLWEDHITWTRLAIVDLAAGAPSTKATVTRLLKNQTDIGNAVKPFYGKAAGTKLTTLLRQHILIAADLIGAAKSGDEAGVANAQKRWTANANQIAALLHSANPQYWPLKSLHAMMLTHLQLTTQEAVTQLKGEWAASIAAYEQVHAEILAMADMLSSGIEQQFPARFS